MDQPPLTVKAGAGGDGGGGGGFGGREYGKDEGDRAARITRHALKEKRCAPQNNHECCCALGSVLQGQLMADQEQNKGGRLPDLQ